MIPTDTRLVLHRLYPTSPERIWRLWTTPAGISSWWAPEGFTASVEVLDLRPGGALVHTLTATGRDQVRFLQDAGMPLTSRSRKEFVDVEEPCRLSYRSTIDFVPGVAPYEHLTVVTLDRIGSATEVRVEMEPLHDEPWTERLEAGRAHELRNLARVVGSGHRHGERRS